MALKLTFSLAKGGLTYEDPSPPDGLDVMKGPDRKALLKAATDAVMHFWIANYLPLKFTGYAWEAGYRVAPGTMKRKKRYQQTGRLNPETGQIEACPDADKPNVITGATRSAAFSTARFQGSGTSTRYGGSLVMNLPQYVNYNPVTNAVVRNITEREGQALAKRFFAIVHAMVASGDVRMTKKGVLKGIRLSEATTFRVALEGQSRDLIRPERASHGEE